jgi:hypothetical protein
MTVAPPMLTMMDEYVRLALINFPSLYPNRLRVLCHTFLVLGNGVEWRRDGTLSTDDFSFDEMRYDDLDDRIARQKRYAEIDPETACAILARMEKRSENERAIRKSREANIIQLATTKVPEDFIFDYDEEKAMAHYRDCIHRGVPNEWGNYGSGYETAASIIDLAASGYLTLNRMPKKVEKSFYNGALEILDVVLRSTPDAAQRAELAAYRGLLEARHTPYDGGLVSPRKSKENA